MDINFLFMALKGKRFSHLILDGNYPSHAFLGLPLIDKYILFIKANDRVALGTERRGRIDNGLKGFGRNYGWLVGQDFWKESHEHCR